MARAWKLLLRALSVPTYRVLAVSGSALLAACDTPAGSVSGLPIRGSSDAFLLGTDLDVPVEPVLHIAERTREFVSKWLRWHAPRNGPRLPILLCRGLTQLEAIERLHGYRVARVPVRLPAGGYYRAVPMIAVTDSRNRRLEVVSHEVVHSVIDTINPAVPDVVNEGLAILFSEMVLSQEGEHGVVALRRDERARTIARASVECQIPPIAQLFALGYRSFREPEDGLYFDLSWCLMKAASESTADSAGKLAELVRACGSDGTAYSAFARIYSVSDVERLWRENIDELVHLAAR